MLYTLGRLADYIVIKDKLKYIIMNYKDKEINSTKHSEDVAETLVDIMQGNEPDDITHLMEWIANNELSIDKLDKLSNESYLENIVSNFNRPEKQDKVKEFQMKLNRMKRRVLFIRIAAVAVVSSISTLLYVQLNNSDSEVISNNYSEQTNDITITQPTLVTSIGKTLVVDKNTPHTDDDIVDINSLVETVNERVGSSLNSERVEVVTKYNRFIVPNGSSSKILLVDGTVVHLNANSELIFPDNFNGDERKVTFIGEGYFTVAKSDKKFIVSTQYADINVYGTEFNINTFNMDGVEVYLRSGVIGVSKKGGSKDIIMEPKHLLKMSEVGGSSIQKIEDDRQFIGWLDGYFIFDKTPIEEAIGELSRWYGNKIEVENISEIKEVTITGSFRNKAEYKDIIKSIENVTDVKFKLKNN